MSIDIYHLNTQEMHHIQEMVQHIAQQYRDAEDEAFLTRTRLYADELSPSLKDYLFGLSSDQTHQGLALIRGFVPLEPLPKTPKTWFKQDSYAPQFSSDYLAMILASILGEPFGFETQQAGKLIHDILPIAGREHHQEGSSSLAMLNFHTEDTCHPYRADFICLNCLKNPDNVGTLISGVRHFELDTSIRHILYADRFYHLSDNTHTAEVSALKPESILFGHPQSPYIRYDYDFSVAQQGDEEAAQALQQLYKQIIAKQQTVALQPGDYCFIDNYKWLHGRQPFTAHFCGHDRWLRRFNIKVDLNEAMDYRRTANSRMLTLDKVSIT